MAPAATPPLAPRRRGALPGLVMLAALARAPAAGGASEQAPR